MGRVSVVAIGHLYDGLRKRTRIGLQTVGNISMVLKTAKNYYNPQIRDFLMFVEQKEPVRLLLFVCNDHVLRNVAHLVG